MRTFLLSFLSLLLPFFLTAQPTSPPGNVDAVQVFLDCNWFCDMDFVRMEIDYVDYVRDQFLSNVYILATEQSTGGGGSEIKLLFQGQGVFQHLQDTLTFYRVVNETDDEFRQNLVRYLSAGLIPYLARSPRFFNIRIVYDKDTSQTLPANTSQEEDPWNFWLFRVGFQGYANGDNIYRSRSFEGEFNGSRITQAWKHFFSLSAESNNNVYEYEDDEGVLQRLENPNHDLQASFFSAKSMTDHWSAAVDIDLFRNTFRNYAFVARGKLGLEYNVFPYPQSNQRILTFQYFLGATGNHYLETTIYDQDRELLFLQEFDVNLNLVQKWGELFASVYWENFLHDFRYNNINGYVSANIRLFKGFAFNVGAGASIIHNQLNIQKGDISESDVLIRRRQLETSFDYWINFGVNYTFGSVYNNIVNPRFWY